MSLVKKIKMSPEVVLFWKPSEANGWLSNWSLHSFMKDGVFFKTAEHYIMYSKALLVGEVTYAQKILAAKSPSEAKKIGRRIPKFDYDLWVRKREDVAFEAISLKVKCNPGLRETLIGTKDKLIAEASPFDDIWGIGCSKEDSRASDPTEWKGENLLGKAWIRLREELREE